MSSFFFEAVKRVAIGVGIDFLFNCLSNIVQIHYYNIPIAPRLEKSTGKRHVLAPLVNRHGNSVRTLPPVLISCFQARESGNK